MWEDQNYPAIKRRLLVRSSTQARYVAFVEFLAMNYGPKLNLNGLWALTRFEEYFCFPAKSLTLRKHWHESSWTFVAAGNIVKMIITTNIDKTGMKRKNRNWHFRVKLDTSKITGHQNQRSKKQQEWKAIVQSVVSQVFNQFKLRVQLEDLNESWQAILIIFQFIYCSCSENLCVVVYPNITVKKHFQHSEKHKYH